jgi:site-specific recombinase
LNFVFTRLRQWINRAHTLSSQSKQELYLKTYVAIMMAYNGQNCYSYRDFRTRELKDLQRNVATE